MITSFHASGAGNLGIQAPVQNLVFNIRQKRYRSLFVANAFGVAIGPETGADKDVKLRFVHE
jgi:hypothetical protein